LDSALRDAGHEVIERGATTLVAWDAGSDDAATATRDRLADQGIVIRDLPGAARLRASVGAWNDEDDLARLVAALG
jgi:L-cysteine/cystine lyase